MTGRPVRESASEYSGLALPNAPAVVLVSHEFWTRRLGANPAVVGTSLGLDDRPALVRFLVIGFLDLGERGERRPIERFSAACDVVNIKIPAVRFEESIGDRRGQMMDHDRIDVLAVDLLVPRRTLRRLLQVGEGFGEVR